MNQNFINYLHLIKSEHQNILELWQFVLMECDPWATCLNKLYALLK